MLENDVKRQKRDGFFIKILELSYRPHIGQLLKIIFSQRYSNKLIKIVKVVPRKSGNAVICEVKTHKTVA